MAEVTGRRLVVWLRWLVLALAIVGGYLTARGIDLEARSAVVVVEGWTAYTPLSMAGTDTVVIPTRIDGAISSDGGFISTMGPALSTGPDLNPFETVMVSLGLSILGVAALLLIGSLVVGAVITEVRRVRPATSR